MTLVYISNRIPISIFFFSFRKYIKTVVLERVTPGPVPSLLLDLLFDQALQVIFMYAKV